MCIIAFMYFYSFPDPCSIEKNIRNCAERNQFCYNSYSSKNKVTTTCRCPPTVKMVKGECKEKSK